MRKLVAAALAALVVLQPLPALCATAGEPPRGETSLIEPADLRSESYILPVSDVRVHIDTASVTGLSCSGRPFGMEYTRSVGRSYRYMAQGVFTRDPDPRSIIMGLVAMVVMLPIVVLSVPADLVAAPFRRQCSFDFRAEATLTRPRGPEDVELPVTLEARNLLDPGVEGVAAPTWFVSIASAAADAGGRFTLGLPGKVGRSKELELGWSVKGLRSGGMRLSRSGKDFLLTEPEEDSEIGASFETPPPLVIHPH